ncbi:MAG: hypothetical protein EOO61_10260, partial [Hymenobacter sp.]
MEFVFPKFLWGLLGIGIPIVLHLLQLRRPQRIQFTNNNFIKEIEFKKGHRRLQDLIVLALRIVAITFLTLTFCQPFISVGKGPEGVQVVEVFADNSASMQLLGRAQKLVEQAASAAYAIGTSYSADTRLQLLGYSNRAATKSAFLTGTAKLPQRHEHLGWGNSLIKQALSAHTGGPLYVISDFQKNEMSATEMALLSGDREIVLVPQIRPPLGNVYVDSIWLDDAFARVRANVKLHIRLRNGGDRDVKDCPTKVLLEKKQVAAFQATVLAGQLAEISIQVAVPDQSIITGQVQLADAPATFDNVYYFTLQPAQAIQVVEIGSSPATHTAYNGEQLFRYNHMQPQAIDFNRLRQANMVLLNEVVELNNTLQEALQAVVRRGGSLVIIPSALPAAHATISQLLRVLGTGNIQWDAIAKPVQQEVAMPDSRSPFFKEVFGTQPRQVAMPSASPVLQLAGSGTDILRFRDGEGFLTEFTQGAGRVYVFAAPLNNTYSDFKAHALFIPVMYRLAMLSYRDDQALAHRIGQAAVTLRVLNATPRADAAAYRLVHDSSTLVPTQRQQGQQLRLEIPAELTQPGFYQVQQQGRSISTLAFNVPKAESALAAYSVSELRQLVGNRPNVHVLEAGDPQ